MRTRRCYLATGVGLGLVALAGCTGRSIDESIPEPETAPTELLPDTESWPLRESETFDSGLRGADIAARGYWGGQDGEYIMEIVRFTDRGGRESGQARAEQAANGVYSVWLLSLSHGDFSFAVNNSDTDTARDLLSASPVLSRELVDAKTSALT